jgi:cytochrome c oxidase subunit 2
MSRFNPRKFMSQMSRGLGIGLGLVYGLGVSVARAGTLPISATEAAEKWDVLYWFLVALSAFFFVLVVGGMLYLVVRYRAKPGTEPHYIVDNHLVEGLWTVIPLGILLVLFGWSFYVYQKLVHVPADAYEVRVVGKQWLWQFQYKDGRTFTNEVFVPTGRPVKLVMTSEDVIHSFFVPNFRIKSDVVPGMYTTVWFETSVPGQHQVFCTEYCGTSHSTMLAKVVALTPEQWERFEAGKKVEGIADAADGAGQLISASGAGLRAVGNMIAQGKKLVEAKNCVACHSANGKRGVGPTFLGLSKSQAELADGSKINRDDNYLRESLMNPQARVVKGFAPAMPSFKGQLSEFELNSVLEYLKSL